MNNNALIKFYVCVPIYNAKSFINSCIDKIEAQTYKNYLLILVDDGSDDGSSEICDKRAEKNEKIKVIHQENKGQIRARLTAIEYAQNDFEKNNNIHAYIVFVDADDILKIGALKTIEKVIEENPNTDMVVYGYDKINSTGQIIEKYNDEKCFEGKLTDKKDIFKIVVNNKYINYYPLWNKAIKINLFYQEEYENKLLNLKWGEDAIQSFDLYNKSNVIVFIKESLYQYKINPTSITFSLDSIKQLQDCIIGTEYIDKILTQPDVIDKTDYAVFIKNNATTLMSKLSGIINSFHLKKKTKIKILSEISKNKACMNCILNKQTTYLSLKLLKQGKIKLSFLSIRVWSVAMFFKYAFLKGKNRISAILK